MTLTNNRRSFAYRWDHGMDAGGGIKHYSVVETFLRADRGPNICGQPMPTGRSVSKAGEANLRLETIVYR